MRGGHGVPPRRWLEVDHYAKLNVAWVVYLRGRHEGTEVRVVRLTDAIQLELVQGAKVVRAEIAGRKTLW